MNPTIRAYLQLVRLPAVFTAMADILLGFLLNHLTLGEAPGRVGLLVLSSSCLYMSGMALNDVFDRKRDARQRPERPIPSGRVSLRSAAVVAVVLMLGGIGAAAGVAIQSLYVAVGLGMCILAYDGLLKSTPFGPLAMGGCRFLNVMLGASAFEWSFSVWATPQTFIAAGLGVYIVGVTWFARNEAELSSRRQLVGGSVVANLGLLMLCAYVARPLIPAIVLPLVRLAGTGLGEADPRFVLLLLAMIAVIINRRLVAAIRNPSPAVVQPAVKTMLLSLVMLDAAVIHFHTGEPLYSLATAGLVIPAMIVGRWVYVT